MASVPLAAPADAGEPPLAAVHPLSPAGTDRDAVELRRFAGLVIAVCLLLVATDLAVAALSGAPDIALCGLCLAVFAGWLAWARSRVAERGVAWFVPRFVVVVFTLVVAIAAVLPDLAPAMTAAALVPVAAAMPFVPSRALRRLMVAAWVLCLGVAIAAEMGIGLSGAPPWVLGALRVSGVATVAGLLLFLLWQYRQRLSDAATEMGGLVTLSRDLADTLDPQQVGERLARHLAEGTRAQVCIISSWDRPADRVATFASFPPERLERFAPLYPLADFPLTRRVLEERLQISLHANDPGADPSEVAILRTENQTALAMLPLVAKGEVVGLIELTRFGERFDEREMTLAYTFATEAAMALENARLYQELRHQAFHDGLTRLANRALFTDRLEHALARGERRQADLAVLFIDVDDFKTINDRLGHAKGDRLLVSVADRLRACLRAGDTAARVGGDEFAVLLEDLSDQSEAEVVAHRILDVMSQPVQFGEVSATTGVSIGICFAGMGGETADALLRNADFAMYRAKTLGKARAETFRPSMRAGASAKRELEGLLQGAVARRELRLQYQPVIALRTGRIAGVEALVRWDVPGQGTRMPADFITLAEESGLIVPIGRWVLREASRQTKAWQRLLEREDFAISINLSARQFQHPAIRSDILAALRATSLGPEAVVVEITESVLMQHTPSTLTTLQALRDAGIRVAVDDFGTGYSSLSYLQRFPIDILKVDRSFVEGAATGHEGSVLARAIVELGRALGMRVVAEGIEQPEQLRAMRSFGCGFGQGYLFAHPLDAHEMEALLRSKERSWDGYWADEVEAGVSPAPATGKTRRSVRAGP